MAPSEHDAGLVESAPRVPRVTLVGTCKMHTPWAEFDLHGFEETGSAREHVALTLGSIGDGAPVLAAHAFGVPDRRRALQPALRLRRAAACRVADIGERGRGVVLYLRQEGRGIGLLNKIRAYACRTGRRHLDANRRLGIRRRPARLRSGAALLDGAGSAVGRA